MATLGPPPDRQQEIMYTGLKIIGNGSFGVVYQAKLVETNEPVAIKKVLQDKRFKNRELQIMRRLDHCNIIRLQYFFYSAGEKVRSLVLFVPSTCISCGVWRHLSSQEILPLFLILLYRLNEAPPTLFTYEPSVLLSIRLGIGSYSMIFYKEFVGGSL